MTTALMGARFAKNPFPFTPSTTRRPRDKKEIYFFFITRTTSGAGFFTTKRLAPGEQGEPPYNGRRYFQKYVDEAAKEVKEIFGAVVLKLLIRR